jgi:hypothetical protein
MVRNDGSLPPDAMLDVPRLDYATISTENRERTAEAVWLRGTAGMVQQAEPISRGVAGGAAGSGSLGVS